MQFVSRIFRYIYLLFTVKEVPPSFHERIVSTINMIENQEKIRQAWNEALDKSSEVNE